jgi:hypothetical protein
VTNEAESEARAMLAILKLSEKDIAEGRYAPHDEVFARLRVKFAEYARSQSHNDTKTRDPKRS